MYRTQLVGGPLLLLVALGALGLNGCSYDTHPSSSTVAAVRRDPVDKLSPVDTGVDPCEDFYHYACNPWLQAHPPPTDRLFAGRGLPAVHERTRIWLWEQLAAPGASPASPLAAFYASCMDDDAASRRGLNDLTPLLEAIDAGSEPAALLRAIAALHRVGVAAVFSGRADHDWEIPGGSILLIAPAALPYAPQAYADDSRAAQGRMRRYESHIAFVLKESGAVPDAAAAAARALAVERRLAAALPPAPDARPAGFEAQRLERTAFDQLVAPLPFDVYFAAAGFGQPQALAVSSPASLQASQALIVNDGVAMQDYLRWALLRAAAPHLPGAFRTSRFDYGAATSANGPSRDPRWQECVEIAEAAFPDEVALLYASRAAAADTQDAVRSIGEAIQRAAVRRLEHADYLDPIARRTAADKVGRMIVRVGLPAAAAASPPVQPDAYLANLLAANTRAFARMAAQLTSGPDPRALAVSSSTANAFYRHGLNDVVIPLALAQAPFFSTGQPAAANFGALGFVIGHEVGHAFDRTGRQIDAGGRRRDWAAQSDAPLRAREQCLGERLAREQAAPRYEQRTFAGSQMLQPLSVDPERTTDEHTADIAGLTFAYDAYREYVAAHGTVESGTAATSDDRQFFLAYAQSWCTSVHPAVAHWLAGIDTHAPAPPRVNRTLAELPAFGAAYDCPMGATLRPSQTCDVW